MIDSEGTWVNRKNGKEVSVYTIEGVLGFFVYDKVRHKYTPMTDKYDNCNWKKLTWELEK